LELWKEVFEDLMHSRYPLKDVKALKSSTLYRRWH